MQRSLPRPRRSKELPLQANLSVEELYEFALLRLQDDDWSVVWNEYQDKLAKLKFSRGETLSNGPVVTGNAIVDAWERELFAQYGGKQ